MYLNNSALWDEKIMSTYRHNRNVMKNDKEVGGSSISLTYESVNPLNPESLSTQISFKLINKINGALVHWTEDSFYC